MTNSDAIRPQEADLARRHIWEFQAARDFAWLVLAVALIWLFRTFSAVMAPALVALLMAYLVTPIARWIRRRWGWSRGVTAGVLLLALAIVVGAAVWLAAPVVARQTADLIEKLPAYVEQVSTRFGLGLDASNFDADEIAKQVREEPGKLLRSVGSGAGYLFGVAGSVFGGVSYAIAATILAAVLFVLFAAEMPRLYDADQLLPQSIRDRVTELARKFEEILGGFVRGQFIIAFCIMIGFWIGFYLIGVPYWFVVGLVGGNMSAVPYGQGLGCILAGVVQFIDMQAGNGDTPFYWVIVGPTLVYLCTQGLEMIIQPWVQGAGLQLPPLVVLAVVLAGGMIGGLLGVLLAIPLAAFAKVLWSEEIWPAWRRWAEAS